MMAVASQDFLKQLKLALKHFHHPQWLGEQSPLAAPYFLGTAQHDKGQPEDPMLSWGQTLQYTIRRAGERLWGSALPAHRRDLEAVMPEILLSPGSPRYHYLVLELRYFRDYFKPRKLADIWHEFLGESRSEFYRDLDEAIAYLGEVLLQLVRPTYRLEQPTLSVALIGRDEMLTHCLQALQTGQTVALSGAGGVGKTSLGTAVYQAWPSDTIFWYTFHPGLNDQLSSLLFSLGYFLQQHGATNLWQKLAADKGKVGEVHLVLGLIRADLAQLQTAHPLLCFDELDRLRPLDVDQMLPAHRQLLEFLDSLRSQVALLLIGQRTVLDADVHYPLTGLSLGQMKTLLTEVGVPFTVPALKRLHHYTQGNPRLLRLCLALQHKSETLSHLLQTLPKSAALRPLLDRLWLRVASEERQLLQQLAVFRTPAPADAWLTQQPVLDSLVERGLIQPDKQGGVLLWPALRTLIYQELPIERRETYHLQAAGIRTIRGEYTAAAYHYLYSGGPKQAIQVWYPRRQQEIGRGQAEAALAIFEAISLNHLKRREREALALLRGELRQLRGDNKRGLQEIRTITWPPGREVTVSAKFLEGHFLNALGYPEAALNSYEAGITTIARLQNQLVFFRNRRSRIYARQRQVEAAWDEARLARYEAENLQGFVQKTQGNYAEAYVHYQHALELAQAIRYHPGVARTHRDLANLFTLQGKPAKVIEHAQVAIQFYDRIGDQFNRETIRNILSGTYLQTKQFDKALQTGHQALRFFEEVGYPYGIAATAVNLAEGYFGKGDMVEAERLAYYVLQQEEAFTHPFGLYTLGMVRHTQGSYQEAIRILRESMAAAEQNQDRYMLAYAQRGLGITYYDQGNEEQGEYFFQQAHQLFIELGMEIEIAETEALWSR